MKESVVSTPHAHSWSPESCRTGISPNPGCSRGCVDKLYLQLYMCMCTAGEAVVWLPGSGLLRTHSGTLGSPLPLRSLSFLICEMGQLDPSRCLGRGQLSRQIPAVSYNPPHHCPKTKIIPTFICLVLCTWKKVSVASKIQWSRLSLSELPNLLFYNFMILKQKFRLGLFKGLCTAWECEKIEICDDVFLIPKIPSCSLPWGYSFQGPSPFFVTPDKVSHVNYLATGATWNIGL